MQSSIAVLFFDTLAKRGFDLSGMVEVEQIITPTHLEELTGAFRGSTYGLSSNDWLAPARRPHPRAKVPTGLFFTGGTTHPGSGVPMAILSGKYVANLIGQG
jgi:phytoene dehydrogenase-like protein